MRLFITGGSGLLGSKLAEIASEEGHEVYSGYLDEPSSFGTGIKYDLNDFKSIEKSIEKVKPDAIVHTAAMTNVDQCEENPVQAFRINSLATKHISTIAKKKNIFLHYISTDYVFDGEKGNYREDDEINPIDVYGFTKYFGELWVDSIGRTSMIYGALPAWGKINFALWVINNLKNHEEVKIVEDQFGSPTLNTNLAGMVLEIVEKKLLGVYHLAGGTRISRFDFTMKLAKKFDFDTKLIKRIKMDQLSWKAKRPMDSSLDTKFASSVLSNKPSTIDHAIELLKDEIDNIKKEMNHKIMEAVLMGKLLFNETGISGLYLIEPSVFGDDRGFFIESFNSNEFMDAGLDINFVQDNHSRSAKGVLRGMHFQKDHAQDKLIRVTRGAVFDVVIDLRKSSETFGKWIGFTLSEENKKMLFIPKGFAHGFLTLTELVDFQYKCSDFYFPDDEGGIRWDDPKINIVWPLDKVGEDLIISEKDKNWPYFDEFANYFD